MQRLNTMVSGLVLRRTKDELDCLKLPEKIVTEHSIELNDAESNIHQYMYNEIRFVVIIGWFGEFL